MVAKNAKQLVYPYNGVESSDEVEQDLDGERELPLKGDIVIRNDRHWKVVQVMTELSGSSAIPVVRVFLSDLP